MRCALLWAGVACALILCCLVGTGCSVKMLDTWQAPDFSYASARSDGLAVGGMVFSLSTGRLKEKEMPAYAAMLAEHFSRTQDDFGVLPWDSLRATVDSTRLSILFLHYSGGNKLTREDLEELGDGSGKARYLVFGRLDRMVVVHKKTTEQKFNHETTSQDNFEVWATICQAGMVAEVYDLQNGELVWQARAVYEKKDKNTYEEKDKSVSEWVGDAILGTGKREYPADPQVDLVVKTLLNNLGKEFHED